MLITLVTVGVIGMYLTAHLNLVSNQNISTMRSLQWNSAIATAEAGIEEALTQLYYNPVVRSLNGWALTDGAYTKERVIGEEKYVTTISTNFSPVIISKAYVRKPFSSDFLNPPRTIRVTVTNAALWGKGMVAKGKIDLNGNSISTDSFDSSDPNYSTNGQYDPNKIKDNGDVATNSTLTDSLNTGSAQIYGRASTGPNGTITIGSSGSIGSTTWHQGNNLGIESGWSSDDMNVNFPDVQVPFNGGALTPVGGLVGLTNYTYVLTSGNWQMSSLSMSSSDRMIVMGDAVLYVTGNVSISGQAFIYVPTNGTLRMYVAGTDASISGKGVVNTPGNATNFYYFGLPSNKTISMSGNAAFTGSMYSPSAALTLGGGGNNSYDFIGATVTDSVTMNGHFNFHYDEALGKAMSRGLTITSWNEL